MSTGQQNVQNKYWLLIVVAACFEVLWVIGLKHSEDFWAWSGTIVAIAISFGLLIHSSRYLPTSTAYAVFVGLGTTGTVIAEMALFDSPFRIAKVVLIALLLVGIIGLKTVTKDSAEDPAVVQKEAR